MNTRKIFGCGAHYLLSGVLAVIFALALSACDDGSETDDTHTTGTKPGSGATPPGGTSKDDAIPLTANQWADGNITTSGGEQWFTFTATASTQYLHFDPTHSLSNVYVWVYDSGGAEVESEEYLYSSNTSTSRTLTNGQTYYIKVWPSPSSFGSDSGAYRIAFNTSIIPPGITPIPLTVNQWADGNITTSGGEQWFTFTATASTQYLHFDHGTLAVLTVQVYDSGGAEVESKEYLYISFSTPTSKTLTSGQTYYIRVSSDSGAYRIAFNTTTTAPPVELPTDAITLTANQWADGNIPSSGGNQWFTFTATASTQYLLHFDPTHSLSRVYVWVYDSGGAEVASKEYLYSSNTSTSRTLTNGQTYYIRVRPYYSGGDGSTGAYRIGFNTSTTAPTS